MAILDRIVHAAFPDDIGHLPQNKRGTSHRPDLNGYGSSQVLFGGGGAHVCLGVEHLISCSSLCVALGCGSFYSSESTRYASQPSAMRCLLVC